MTMNKNLAVASVLNDLIGDVCREMRDKCNIPDDVYDAYMEESVYTHPEKFMLPAVNQIGEIMEKMDDEEAADYHFRYLMGLAQRVFHK